MTSTLPVVAFGSRAVDGGNLAVYRATVLPSCHAYQAGAPVWRWCPMIPVAFSGFWPMYL